MLKVLKALDIKKSGVFAAGVLFGTAGVKSLQVKMPRRFTPTAQQLSFVQKHAF